MRIKITFKLPGIRQVLPLNYQYPLSAWIYKVISNADKKIAGLLHETGFKLENQKTFKLFTFSNLQFPHGSWKIIRGSDRMEIFSHQAVLIIGFQIPEILNNFVAGLFKDQLMELGDKISTINMEVGSIEMMKEPRIGEKVKIHLLSPLVISRKTAEDQNETYLHPEDKDYANLFFKNLIDKHNAWQLQTGETPTDFNLESLKFKNLTQHPISRLQTIKAFTETPIRVRGFLFDFEISTPPGLIKTGLNSGFGAMNALGFGCGECVDVGKGGLV